MDANDTNDGGGEVLGVAGALLLGDVYCARCGYNLRTLAGGSKCPECGLSVAESVAHGRRHGVALRHPRRIAAAAAIAAVAHGLLCLSSVLQEVSLIAGHRAVPMIVPMLYFGTLVAVDLVSGISTLLLLMLAARSDAPVAPTRRNRTARVAGAWALVLYAVSEVGTAVVMGIMLLGISSAPTATLILLARFSRIFSTLAMILGWGVVAARYFYIWRLARTRRDDSLRMWNWWFLLLEAAFMAAGTAGWGYALVDSLVRGAGGSGFPALDTMPVLVHGVTLFGAAVHAAHALFFFPLVAVVAWRSPKVGEEAGGDVPVRA